MLSNCNFMPVSTKCWWFEARFDAVLRRGGNWALRPKWCSVCTLSLSLSLSRGYDGGRRRLIFCPKKKKEKKKPYAVINCTFNVPFVILIDSCMESVRKIIWLSMLYVQIKCLCVQYTVLWWMNGADDEWLRRWGKVSPICRNDNNWRWAVARWICLCLRYCSTRVYYNWCLLLLATKYNGWICYCQKYPKSTVTLAKWLNMDHNKKQCQITMGLAIHSSLSCIFVNRHADISVDIVYDWISSEWFPSSRYKNRKSRTTMHGVINPGNNLLSALDVLNFTLIPTPYVILC